MPSENLQDYIYEHIPIVKANNFRIDEDNEGSILVRGACADHINHRNTVFGGSLSTALILTAWANVRKLVAAAGITGEIIVIQSQEVQFSQPVSRDFVARTLAIPTLVSAKFIDMLRKFGKSRILVEAAVTHGDSSLPLTTFKGNFVVVQGKATPVDQTR